VSRIAYTFKKEADGRYEHADGLVGVYREQEENSSKTLSLDLRKVSSCIPFLSAQADLQYVE